MFEFAYVGVLVPDRAPFNVVPFSRSANLYQTQMLDALREEGLSPSLILSHAPVGSYPFDKRLWVSGGDVTDENGNRISLLGFPNVTPIKQAWLGAAAFAKLSLWSLERLGTPRIIHSYNLTVPSGVFLWLAARLTGARVSASLCDIEVPGQTVPNSFLFRFDRWMHRFLIPRLDGRVVVADAIAEDFAPSEHYLRVEGGVGEDLITRTKDLPATRHAAPRPFRMVAVGRLDAANGFDLMVDAMKLLGDVDAVLDVAGYGPLASKVEEAAKQDPRVRMHGFVPLDGVMRLYSEADLILIVRRTQTQNTKYFFPGKLMEALVTGVPVLATNTGHLKTEYGSALYVLEDETAEGLARRIREIIAQPREVRRKLAQDARAWIISAKSWQEQGRKVLRYLMDQVVR